MNHSREHPMGISPNFGPEAHKARWIPAIPHQTIFPRGAGVRRAPSTYRSPGGSVRRLYSVCIGASPGIGRLVLSEVSEHE